MNNNIELNTKTKKRLKKISRKHKEDKSKQSKKTKIKRNSDYFKKIKEFVAGSNLFTTEIKSSYFSKEINEAIYILKTDEEKRLEELKDNKLGLSMYESMNQFKIAVKYFEKNFQMIKEKFAQYKYIGINHEGVKVTGNEYDEVIIAMRGTEGTIMSGLVTTPDKLYTIKL
jgi:hypothetical protein